MFCAIFVIAMLLVGAILFGKNLEYEADYKRCNEYREKCRDIEEIFKNVYTADEYNVFVAEVNDQIEPSKSKTKMLQQRYEILNSKLQAYRGRNTEKNNIEEL